MKLPFFPPIFYFVLALVFLAPLRSIAASPSSNALDNLNAFPRASAMGSAFVGAADDASALFSNPAGLGGLNQWQFFVNSNLWLVDTRQETLLVGIPGSDGWGNFALAASVMDYGVFEGRDEFGFPESPYSANRANARAGWGLNLLKSLSIGLGIQGSQNRLAESSYTTLSGDIGLLVGPFEGFKIGGSYNNLGFHSGSGAVEDSLNLGASYTAGGEGKSRWMAALSLAVQPSGTDYLQAGAEYGFQSLLFFRAGYQLPLRNNGITGLTGLTAGLGLVLTGFIFDYAYLPYGGLGSSHRVSVGYRFGSDPPAASSQKGLAPGSFLNRNSSVSTGGELKNNSKSFSEKTGINGAGKSSAAEALNPSAYSPSNGGAMMTGASASGTSPAHPLLPKALENQGAVPPVPGLAKAAAGQGAASTETAQPRLEDKEAKDSLVVQFDLAEDAASEGAELEKQGKFQDALGSYQRAAQNNPQDPSPWWAMGDLYRRLGMREKAVESFEQVVRLQPNNQKMAEWLKKFKTPGK